MDITALLRASEIAFEGSRFLCRYARGVKGASKSIEKFANDVDVYSGVIGTAHCALQDHYTRCTKAHTSAPTISYLERHQVIEKLMSQCKVVSDEIKIIKPEVRALEGKTRFWACFKWGLQKMEIAELSIQMESVKLSLSIITNIVLLEGNKLWPETLSSARVKTLERQIRTHLRTIEIQHQLLENLVRRPNSYGDHGFIGLADEVQSALGDLGESMVESREVPDFPQQPIVSQPVLQSQNSRQGYGNTSRSSNHSTRRPRSMSRRQSTRSMPTQIDPDREMSGPRQSSLSNRNFQESEPLRFETLDEGTAVPSEREADATQSHVVAQRESNFVSVREDDNHLRLNPASYRAFSGYVLAPSGRQHTTVSLDRYFGANLISQACAARLGLDVELFDLDSQPSDGALTNDPEIWIDFGDGSRERAVGEAKLEWTPVLDGSKPFPVHCWVCERSSKDMVFGAPFLEKSKYYRRAGRGVG